MPAHAGAGTGFVNLSSYLTANQPAVDNQAGSIADSAANEAAQSETGSNAVASDVGVQDAAAAAAAKTAAGTPSVTPSTDNTNTGNSTEQNQQLATQNAEDATDDLKPQSGNASIDPTTASGYADALSAQTKASSDVNALGNPDSVTASIGQSNPGESAAGRQFDSGLIGQDSTAQSKFQGVQSQYGGLDSYLQNATGAQSSKGDWSYAPPSGGPQTSTGSYGSGKGGANGNGDGGYNPSGDGTVTTGNGNANTAGTAGMGATRQLNPNLGGTKVNPDGTPVSKKGSGSNPLNSGGAGGPNVYGKKQGTDNDPTAPNNNPTGGI